MAVDDEIAVVAVEAVVGAEIEAEEEEGVVPEDDVQLENAFVSTAFD
jgi:hypothetical protein